MDAKVNCVEVVKQYLRTLNLSPEEIAVPFTRDPDPDHSICSRSLKQLLSVTTVILEAGEAHLWSGLYLHQRPKNVPWRDSADFHFTRPGTETPE